jgi:putative endonuclease
VTSPRSFPTFLLNLKYTGSTNDLKRRIQSHQNGEVVSTKLFRPINLKSYIAVETESHARKLELYFKSGSGKALAKKRLLQ